MEGWSGLLPRMSPFSASVVDSRRALPVTVFFANVDSRRVVPVFPSLALLLRRWPAVTTASAAWLMRVAEEARSLRLSRHRGASAGICKLEWTVVARSAS